MDDVNFERVNKLPARTAKVFEFVDNLPPDLRECVHEFGLPIVQTLMQCGIKKSGTIRQIVHEIWRGARQPGQRTQKKTKTGGSAVLAHLDWVMMQAGAGISAKTLLRILAQSDLVIITRDPSEPMVEASIAAIHHLPLMNTSKKHRLRLKAAIEKCVQMMWPHLNDPNL